MTKFLERVPLPITGLMLSIFALGNLVQSYGELFRNILGVLAFILYIVVVLKMLVLPNVIKKELENPVVFSVFPTFSMSTMLLATYIKQINNGLAFGLWVIGLTLHITLILTFSYKHLLSFDIKKVFPSWFVVYVGIVVASITAPAFNMEFIGKIAFYFGIISYVLLLILISKRVFIVKEMPEPTWPTLTIFSAPGSLCLAGYLSSFDNKSMYLVAILLIVSQAIYLATIVVVSRLIQQSKFYPSFSAFTFPLVISAIALKLSNQFLVQSGHVLGNIDIFILVEELIAIIIVAFVLFRYIRAIFASEN